MDALHNAAGQAIPCAESDSEESVGTSYDHEETGSVDSDLQILSGIRSEILRWKIRMLSIQKDLNFLPAAMIEAFGVKTTRAQISDQGVLQFDPCFFRPGNDDLVQKYPIAPLNSHCFETTDASSHLAQDDGMTPPCETLQHVQTELLRPRSPHGDAELSDTTFNLQHLTHWRCAEKNQLRAKSGPKLQGKPRHRNTWCIEQLFRYFDPDYPQPHIMMSLFSPANASDGDYGLSHGEVMAALAVMTNRVMRVGFRNFRVHPILIFSFLGAHHVRIIQVSFDRWTFCMQYSQLWSFYEQNSLVELLLRYYLSNPVRLERPLPS